LDKKKIADFLDSLCERPFADPQVDPAAWQALSSHAALPPPVDAPAGMSTDQAADMERETPTAVLAAILSGTETDAERRAFAGAASQSPAVRADAQSALAFLEGIEGAPQAAPADVVEKLLGADHGIMPGAAGASPATSPARFAAWFSGAGRFRVAGACLLLLSAGGFSLTQYLRPADLPGQPAPVPTTVGRALPPATLPVAPKSALAVADRCPKDAATEAARAARRPEGESARSADNPPTAPAASGCTAEEDRRLVERIRADAEALAAIARAQEEARQAATAEAAKADPNAGGRPSVILRAARPWNGAGHPGDVPSGAAAKPPPAASVGVQRPAAAAPAQARPVESTR
jgi:hypothetical protein